MLIFFSLFNDCAIPVDQSAKFQEASKKGNLIPLYRCIFSDHLTPVLAYRCLVKEDDRDAPSFLFESVEPGSQASSIVSCLVYFFIVLISFYYRAIVVSFFFFLGLIMLGKV